MLSEKEFQAYCNKLNLTADSRLVIENIRKSQPARVVKSARRSTSGRFPSRKMGVTIQFESHKNELPFIYELEHNSSVLEFYDQPSTFKLQVRDKNGRPTAFFHTPDFFVIEKESAYWVECKTEQQLVKLAVSQPNRFKLQPDGAWECPPGNEYAINFGLEYKVRSDQQINWTYERNLEFLDDYLRGKALEIAHSISDQISEIVSVFGITLEEIFNRTKSLIARDVIYQMIAEQRLFVDLRSQLLMEPENVNVFAGFDSFTAWKELIKPKEPGIVDSISTLDLKEGKQLTWNESVLTIVNLGPDVVSLLGNEENLVEFPVEIIDKLLHEGKLTGWTQPNPDSKAKQISKILQKATESDFETANARYRVVLAKLNGESLNDEGASERTIHRWVSAYNKAKYLHGYGYLGLLPQPNLGNRKPKVPEEVLDRLKIHLKNSYQTLKQKSKWIVWSEFLLICEKERLPTISYKAFRKFVNTLDKVTTIEKRQGHRAAYQKREFYLELSLTTPRHGDRPFHIAHIDHTELDIEIIDSKTGENLGRCYLSLLLDAYSRKVLAFYLSFDPPSKVSNMMVLRECVKRHGRLPQILVVDGGKDFASTYFESLLAMFECTKKTRPPAEPRNGAVLERIFGSTNTRFVYNLQGNTQLSKTVRLMTKEVNPKNIAIWDLLGFYNKLKIFLYEVYNKQIPHPTLEMTPDQAFQEGLRKFGSREIKRIPYDENFKIMTLPSARRGDAKVCSQRGIRIDYRNYYGTAFKHPEVDRQLVPVRVDPLDAGIVYAYVRGRWAKCYSEYYKHFKGRSEKEVKLAIQELRRKTSLFQKNREISAKKLANFLLSVEAEESLLIQRMKDRETRAIYGSINSSQAIAASVPADDLTVPQRHLEAVDTVLSAEPIVENETEDHQEQTVEVAKLCESDFVSYGRL